MDFNRLEEISIDVSRLSWIFIMFTSSRSLPSLLKECEVPSSISNSLHGLWVRPSAQTPHLSHDFGPFLWAFQLVFHPDALEKARERPRHVAFRRLAPCGAASPGAGAVQGAGNPGAPNLESRP